MPSALIVVSEHGYWGEECNWQLIEPLTSLDAADVDVVEDTVEGEEGTALVVCHAVGMLAFTRSSEVSRASENASGDQPRAPSDGEMLVDGRDVTGFPNEWEEGIVYEYDRLPDRRKLPYWVEDVVIAAGGNWDAELDEAASVTVDGDLITARGPESSTEAAQTLLDALGVPAQ